MVHRNSKDNEMDGNDAIPAVHALCVYCNKEESEDINWVQCTNCEQWAHFSCAGVDNTITEVEWYCLRCVRSANQLTIPKPSKARSNKGRSAAKSDSGSARDSNIAPDLTEEQFEEAQLERERAFARQIEIREKRLRREIEWNAKQLELERKMRTMELDAQRTMLEEKLKQEQEMLNSQLAAEQEFVKQRDIIRNQLINSRQNVQSLMNAEGIVLQEQTSKKVKTWLENQEKVVAKPGGDVRGAYKKGGKPKLDATLEDLKNKFNRTLFEDELLPASEEGTDHDGYDETADTDGSDDVQQAGAPGSQVVTVEKIFRLTREQIATRKVVSKTLPKFNGDPETWPLFISSFEHTTKACGYSNIENLDRLLNSLEGEALNAVRSMLVLPESVPEVIQDLRRLFGQPEKLLRTLLNKVRRVSPPTTDDLQTFVTFGITVKHLCDHLEAAHLLDHLRNPLLVQQLVEKLPPEYQMKWVEYKRAKKGPPLRLFTDYITCIGDVASEAVAYSMTASEAVRYPKTKFSKTKEFVYVHESADEQVQEMRSEKVTKACWICNRTDHRIRFCDDFRKMNIVERLEAVEKQKLCGICLNKHGDKPCGFKSRCTITNCKGAHHTLLHRVEESVQLQKIECSVQKHAHRSIIFRMIPVTLYVADKQYDTLAFLDEGSSTTLIEETVAKQLNATGVQEPLIVTWTENINRFENSSRKVELMLSARGSCEKICLANVRTVSELVLPKQGMQFAKLEKQYPHLAGLPVRDHPAERASILVGLDNIHLFAPLESRVGQQYQPIAVRSKLGWTVYGPEKQKHLASTYLNMHSVTPVTNQQLHDLMRTQYTLDDVGVAIFGLPEPKEEQRAKSILKATTKRIGERYETGLLWREDIRRFPDNYLMATQRLKALERKLDKHPALKVNVVQQIENYQIKGYAHKITEAEINNTPSSATWYLPINVTLNPHKPGKVRLVWDAAASVKGISLNSELLKGPDMLVSLPKVICHFRERPIAIGGDIQEMYHQIRIRSEDKQAQRFLFRSDPMEISQVYVMDVATFGATCSPSSAQFVKNLNAEQFAKRYPEAAAAIINRHYVDDYYDSLDTVEDAIQRAKEVKYIHAKGGFHIRNWLSNSEEFLRQLGAGSRMETVHFNHEASTECERVLGIAWEPASDRFCFTTTTKIEEMTVDCENYPTKRIVLSVVMAQFDPLGFISPITVRGKMLIQDLWRTGCEWDEPIDTVSFAKWTRWIRMMKRLEFFKVPRSYFGDAKSGEIKNIELHLFADASESAYGCVAYFRASVRGKIACALVMGRSKVAPLKQISIPRLELMAAVLAARMSRTVCENHSFAIEKIVYWIDASVVLSWIRSDQRRYKQFVGFRIGEILSLTKLADWRWVPTTLNVADQLTKWGTDPQLHSDSVWLRGPRFLYQSEHEWPKKELSPANTTEELRIHLLLHDVKLQENVIDVSSTRISKWAVLVRTMACVFRFISNCRLKVKGLPIETLKPTGWQLKLLKPNRITHARVPLRQEEYEKAEQCLLKAAQEECFADEIKVLKRNKNRPINQWLTVEKSSCLSKLTPLIDEAGIIRMEGRCARAETLPFDLRFPIILPAGSRVTYMIVQHFHEQCGHGYRQMVKNELRQLYYVIHADAVVRKVSSSCVWCKVHRNSPNVPREAPLPLQRLTPGLRSFSFVGIDYLGPFEVAVLRRKEKRWIALFTCLATRAVHLEVTHSLTTQSCLMAISRFVGRRDWPIEFLSDNGTNFQGASKELRELMKDINFDCADAYTNARTRWSFNPPAAPHMGGVWERMVRSVKEALRALDDGKQLTDEILQIAIVEAEDMINSRPLTYVSQDAPEADALTPNHFLRGPPSDLQNVALPSPHPSQALRDTYKRSCQVASGLWQRWIKEYVPSLNKRSKWFGETRPLKAGDLVYIVEGGSRKCWVRGVVEEPIVSSDGRIRQAWVRTKTKRYKGDK
ncbi:uncharacterized protein LOC128736742 [Sabethes cyaneus]|uniref:uncharacterized protein LOC128736742 n=1 Tax=Sabethes cyaneus TaxID=53552 RepID=UPI00237EA971|nr:uncharacterized protein LOC128736742 [Sabethes cyaneus]